MRAAVDVLAFVVVVVVGLAGGLTLLFVLPELDGVAYSFAVKVALGAVGGAPVAAWTLGRLSGSCAELERIRRRAGWDFRR